MLISSLGIALVARRTTSFELRVQVLVRRAAGDRAAMVAGRQVDRVRCRVNGNAYLWLMPSEGGAETQLLDNLNPVDRDNWLLTAEVIISSAARRWKRRH